MVFANLQVVDVLLIVGNVAPIALYFLILGLVNSHARPYLVTSRSDFVALSVALMPVLLWPLPAIAAARAWWLLAAGLVAAGVLFHRFLPRVGAGFVIYNVTERTCLRMVDHSLRGMGLRGEWNEHTWTSDCGRLRFDLRKFPLLRNVTLNVDAPEEQDPRLLDELAARLRENLAETAQLPTAMGACLVLIGAGLLIVPMWMVGRHIHDIVDAMSHLFG